MPKPSARKLWGLFKSRLLIAAVVLALVGCHRQPEAESTAGLSARTHQDLLIGYALLAETLADESRLGTLDFFKTMTLDAPNDAIATLMKTLSDASKRRASELSKLPHLAPDVSRKPAVESPMVAAMATETRASVLTMSAMVWLRRLAVEYEGYRGDLIKYLGGREASRR